MSWLYEKLQVNLHAVSEHELLELWLSYDVFSRIVFFSSYDKP